MTNFGVRFGEIFGGQPGWLLSVFPAGQSVDLDVGRSSGPAGSFARTPGGYWIPTSQALFIDANNFTQDV